jgi:hypothetical protein
MTQRDPDGYSVAKSIAETLTAFRNEKKEKVRRMRLFHTSEARQPAAYQGEGWTFEPDAWEGNEQYAPVYNSPLAAQAAADRWEEQEAHDAAYDAEIQAAGKRSTAIDQESETIMSKYPDLCDRGLTYGEFAARLESGSESSEADRDIARLRELESLWFENEQ